jgi:hypothetical protein
MDHREQLTYGVEVLDQEHDLHAPWACSLQLQSLGRNSQQPRRLLAKSFKLNVVQRDIGRLAQYTIEMGGGVDLLETALRIPPWEPLYRLSADELQRMRLTTVDAPFDRDLPHKKASAGSATSLATVGRPGGDPRD